ncbi:TetR family transcriptional regulator C-terminal domain-containing protein [Frigoribacterium sp. PhB116]|uniref:TetR family transcriptional regulator C-terminal domain-containing protein n=1 Tax=Frigoribacterium sp. PhB116 TaxID=2485174 RepID=UPI0010621FC2|nr:TetR family transcriptional regulator C-terminal domain-containing protein [Frigoribacterium sp. PhB116]TDT63149.1 TetR family transcriptional regulator [Frigoribacterium sp. PhB116]
MPRLRDDDARRLQLSEAVFATLAELGPGGLTLRAVAERAGCTTGLVLHTFRDKQALLLHARDVLHERSRLRAERLEAEADADADADTVADPDPAAAVRAVASASLPTDAEGLAEARVWVGFVAAALSDPVLAERHSAANRSFVARLSRLLEAARGPDGTDVDGDAGTRDPDGAADAATRASALVAAIEGIATLTAGDPAAWPAERQHAALAVTLTAVLTPA